MNARHERLMRDVVINPITECWIWKGSARKRGGGHVWFQGKLHSSAMRFAREALIGPVPPGLRVHITCGDKRCCNPAHSELITQGQLMQLNAAQPVAKAKRIMRLRKRPAKFTTEQIVEMRARMAAGELPFRLAQEYGVTKSMMYQIRDNKVYQSHLWHI